MEALEAMARPSTYFAAVLVMGLLPGLVLRLLVRLYPKDHPRRTELLAELYALPWWERPFFVAQVIEVATCEGLPLRAVRTLAAARRRGSRLAVDRADLATAAATLVFSGLSVGLAAVFATMGFVIVDGYVLGAIDDWGDAWRVPVFLNAGFGAAVAAVDALRGAVEIWRDRPARTG